MTGIQRIESFFKHHKGYIGYLTAGDGGIQRSLDAALALINGGINMLEIGVPFSDPIADGPIIQRAAVRALEMGTTFEHVLWLIKQIRKKSAIPLILFTYLNPILPLLQTSFFKEIQDVGVDGLLVVDCPFEESQLFYECSLSVNIAPIFIVSTSTSIERVANLSDRGRGFLYYACRKGVTGIQQALPMHFETQIQAIKKASQLPVVAGFGISQRDSAKKVLDYCDGAVVGSLFVKAVEEGLNSDQLSQLAQQINPLARSFL